MKNLHILRLAGFSAFGLSFLSPTFEQYSNKIDDGFQLPPPLTQVMVGVSDITYIFRKKIDNAITYMHELTIKEELPVSTTYKADSLMGDIQESNISSRDDELPDETTLPAANFNTVKPTAIHRKDARQPAKRETDAAEQNKTETFITDSSAEQEIENIVPPDFYVDEEIEETHVSGNNIVPIISNTQESGIRSYPEDLMMKQIDKLKEMSISKGYSAEYALMINLGMRSGKRRFFIIDLKNKKILQAGLVAHGKGKEHFTLNRTYSNKNGSSCSSLGLYKIGSSYSGSFGKSFRLIGLEKTNSNALSRSIVLHSMGCIPDEESDYPICQSEGCPSVSPTFLQVLSQVINASKEPILLWMFDPTIERSNYRN
ncbi:MAG: murein L,D-transpeptidase catalytic domain-containing protein [Chitinophagaceae bacterium]